MPKDIVLKEFIEENNYIKFRVIKNFGIHGKHFIQKPKNLIKAI
jgi:hypothetical protein